MYKYLCKVKPVCLKRLLPEAIAFAGSGKTFTANVAAHTLRHHGRKVVCSAFTAKAACNYAGGVTCHAAFLLKRTDFREKAETTLRRPKQGERLRPKERLALARIEDAELVVIDESTMMRAGELDAVVPALRAVGFKGVLCILGNFAQLGPVLPGADVGATLKHHITSSTALNDPACVHVRLRTNVRMEDDPEFLRACNDIGYGRLAPVEGERGLDGMHHVDLDAAMFNAVPYETPLSEEDTSDDAALRQVREFAHPTMFEQEPYYDFARDGKASIIECPTRAVERSHNEYFLQRLGAHLYATFHCHCNSMRCCESEIEHNSNFATTRP